MRKIIVLAVFFLSVVGFSHVSFAQRHGCDAERLGHDLGEIIVNSVFDGGRHYQHSRQRYQQGGYYVNEYEQARADGYRQARERYAQEQRQQAERTYRQSIEDARRQGEQDFYQRHRRW